MNELQKRLLLLGGGATRYGTAGTTTQTTLASQGGLLINIDSATGDIARTTNGWIEDEKYGFYAVNFANNTSFEFDSAVTRTGRLTLKLSTTDATGRARVLTAPQLNFGSATTNLANSKYFIPCKVNTKYRLYCYVKTNNVAAISSFFDIYTIASTGTSTFINTTNTLSGTNDWTLLRLEFTTGASAVWIGYAMYLNVAGNISDAWFDVNSMTLEEVVEPVANSLTSSSPSLVSFTAVGSTDNIDQSSLTTGSTQGVGFSGAERYWAQAFTPTKSKITGVTLMKLANVGSPTSDVVFNIYTNNAGNPSTTAVSTDYTLTSAQWNAIADNAEFTINLPCTVTAGTQYWIRYYATGTLDAVNYRAISRSTSGSLTRFSSDGSSWSTPGAARTFYFKELYYKPTTNFKASQNNLSVSVSADEDGFLNGSVVNFLTGTATFTETFGTFYLLQYTISGSDLIAEINLPGVGLSASFTSDRTLEYSSDGVTYGSTFPTGVTKVWVKILAYSGFASFSYSIQFSTSGLSILKNYPTNKDIIKQYSTTLGAATTTATYRATKWGFPAIEYSSVDQSQTVNTGSISFPTVAQYQAQQILTTQTNFSGVTLYKKANVGSPTGDITFSIVNDSAGSPGSTVYATSTMSNATYLALSNNAEFTVSLPCSIPVGTYWLKMSYSVSSATDYPVFGATSPSGYSGLYKYGTDGITYGTTYNGDVYFKTLYSTVQYLDVDTTATGSTVAFSELGTSYTTVADGASLAISSTSTPNIFVKANITANRLYLSSNDYNANSDKDGSMKETVVYQVVQ